MKNLTEGNIYKTFILFSLPLVLGGVLSQSFNLIYTVIAGQFLGETGLAVMGSVSPLITFVSSIYWGLGSGFAIFIAKLFGEGDNKKIKSSIGSMYLLYVLGLLLLGVFLIVFHDFVFELLNIDQSIKEETLAYYNVYVGGLFLIISNTFWLFIFNSFGMSQLPFLMSIISSVLNLGGNIFSVVVLKIGVLGIALSSVITAGIIDVIYLIRLSFIFKDLGVEKEKLIDFSSLNGSFGYSIPSCIQQIIMYVVTLLVSPLVNGLGSSASAGYSVVSFIYNFMAAVFQNSSKTLSNYSAQCDGAKKYGVIKKGLFVGLLQGMLLTIPLLVLIMIFYREICSVFFRQDASEEAREYAYIFASRFSPFILFELVCNLFHALFRGVKAMRYLISSTLFASVVRYIVTLIMIKNYGMTGFYIGWVTSWIAETAFVFVIYLIGRWKPEYRDAKALERQKKSAA